LKCGKGDHRLRRPSVQQYQGIGDAFVSSTDNAVAPCKHATDTNGQSIRRSAPGLIMPLLYVSIGTRMGSFNTRSIGVIGLVWLIALSACATTARREAPLVAYRDAAPTGFSREVMYVDDGRDDSDRDAMRFLLKFREGAAGEPINVLALSGGGGGVAFGAGALAPTRIRLSAHVSAAPWARSYRRPLDG
jgi:hypothetical protein